MSEALTQLIFISHSGEDVPDAKALAHLLRQAGMDVWLDVDNLNPGDLWQSKLEEAIRASTAFLVYIGKSGVRGWVDREVRFAISRNIEDSTFHIIPVLGPGAPDRNLLPPFLMQHQYLDLRSGIKDVKKIKQNLESFLKKTPETISVLKEGESPFLGLFSFQEEHAHLFFGRDKEVDNLLDKLKKDHFLAVVGDSGSGKSSLLRAGLIPALHRGRFSEQMSSHESWRTIIVRPGDDPFRQLAYALPDLDSSLKGADRIKVVDICIKQLQEGSDCLTNIVAALVPPGKRTLIFVDQFEELFTQCPGLSSLETRRRFIDSLISAASVKGERPIIHVVIALRVDFFSHCWEHSSLPIRIANNQFAVTKMSSNLLREAIEGPVTLTRNKFEPGLVEIILKDLGEEPGNLPLLQHALHLLWSKREDSKLTHKAYKEIGGVSGAIAVQAEKIYQRMTLSQQSAARKIFIRLTSLGEGTQDTRRRASIKELIPPDDSEKDTLGTIELLASENSRLITLSRELVPNKYEEESGINTADRLMDESVVVEVSHEALIGHWPRLREWLREDRESLLIHRRITQAANEWLKTNKDESLAYPKARLAEAEVFLQKYPDALFSEEREFIEASIQVRETEVLQKVAAKIEKLISLIGSTSGSLEMDKLIGMILAAVTGQEGLGFDRAIFFSVDENNTTLKGVMGIGLSKSNESTKTVEKFNFPNLMLENIIHDIDTGKIRKDSFFDSFCQEITICLDKESILSQTIKNNRPFNVKDARFEGQTDSVLLDLLKVEAFATVPLFIKGNSIGLIWVDRLISGKTIANEDVQLLLEFSHYISSAIQSARLYERVSRAEEELKNIFESMTDMLYFTDKDFIIRRINQAVVKKIGKPKEEIIGRKCYEVFHGKGELWDACPHVKALEQKKPYIGEIEDPYLAGTFVVSNSPIYDFSQSFVGILHISRDITELRSLRERVVHSERMAALSELAARLGHEIRNPIISVGGFARRLEKKLAGDERQEYAKIIVNEVARVENILKELLGFVKSSRVNKFNVNVNDVVKNIIDFITPLIQEKQNIIFKELSEIPLISSVDPDRMKEALLNIIINASQATDHGTITVKTRMEDNDAVIVLSDTGCGIRPEDLKNIFNPFFTTKPQGTGLGLAITHRIIQEHKGKIRVTSEIGKGTSFTIYLPLVEN